VHTRAKLLAFGFALPLLGLACRFTNPTPVAWVATPSAEVLHMTDTAVALTQKSTKFVSTETPVPLPLQTERTPTPLKVEGPWLIYPGRDEEQIFAADLNTNLFRQLEFPAPPLLADLFYGTSPDGQYLLLRTGDFEDETGPVLCQLDAKTLQVELVHALVEAEQLALMRSQPDSASAQAFEAVLHAGGISWRKDRAVFTAALRTRTPNLYAWSPEQNKLQLLAERAEQAFGPLWGPDMHNLIFQETALEPSGPALQANYLVALDYNRQDFVRTLMKIPAGNRASVIGWMNVNQMLVVLADDAGPYALKLVGLSGGTPAEIFEGRFDGFAFDPERGSIVLTIGNAAAEANRQSPGIYVKASASTRFEIMQLGTFTNLQYHPAKGLFSAFNGFDTVVFRTGLLSFMMEGIEHISFAKDGSWILAWNSSAVYLYDAKGNRLQTVREDAISDVFWQPDSRGFYLVTKEALYHYTFPLLQPIKVSDNIGQQSPLPHAWLGIQ
jgi:hypothetical protein